MRLVTFTEGRRTRIGTLNGASVTDLSKAAPKLPTDMIGLLSAGDDALNTARRAEGSHYDVSQVHLESPVPNPRKMLAVALNYRDHLEEVLAARPGFAVPKTPVLFTKHVNSVTGPYDPIWLPPESVQLDYEAELAIVIGKRCRRVPKARAMEAVAGSMIVNDVSIRDWQLASPTMTMGKSWDSHCPMGPALVTPDEVAPSGIDFTCTVNGELRQRSNTNQLLFDIPTLIEHITAVMTLEVGDVILTGTTSGVALWMPGQPWLKTGDRVRCTFEGLGYIENEVRPDPVTTFVG